MIQLISDLRSKGFSRAEIDAAISELDGPGFVDSQPLPTSMQQVIDAINSARQAAGQPSSNQVRECKKDDAKLGLQPAQITSNTRKQSSVLTSHACMCNFLCLCLLTSLHRVTWKRWEHSLQQQSWARSRQRNGVQSRGGEKTV